MPIELAVRLGNAASVTVVEVVNASRGLELTLGVPGVGECSVTSRVSRGVVGKAGEVVIAVDGFREPALLGATGICGVCGCGDLRQVAPCAVCDAVVLVDLAPAMRGTGSVRGSCQRGSDSVELIVSKRLRAGGIEVIRYCENVPGIAAIARVNETVRDVHGVPTGGRGFEFERLEAEPKRFDRSTVGGALS